LESLLAELTEERIVQMLEGKELDENSEEFSESESEGEPDPDGEIVNDADPQSPTNKRSLSPNLLETSSKKQKEEKTE
jgi:hypothetical protein